MGSGYWRSLLVSSALGASILTTPLTGQDATRAATGAASPRMSFVAEDVSNAASYVGGGVAPGEIIYVEGSQLGPNEIKTLEFDGDKVSTQLSGVQVLFDGIPSPLIYVWANQLSAIVPYAVQGRQMTAMEIVNGAERYGPVMLPVVAAVPGIFTLDSSGQGPGAIRNEDNSVNTVTNPADPGSIVAIFATGEGQTNPAGVDGLPALSVYPEPVLPVSIRIDGQEAEKIYAGAAPTLVAGVLQVNARVRADQEGGPAIPVQIGVGGVLSREGVTLAVSTPGGGVPPGASLPLLVTNLAQNPDLYAINLNDDLRDFQILDASQQIVLTGNIQDRVSRSLNSGKLHFAPRLRDLNNMGSGATVFRLEITGYAGTAIYAAWENGSGDVAPTMIERSADGDTVSLIYDPALLPPQESLFPSLATDATTFSRTGRMTVYARMPDQTVLSTVISDTNRPD